MAFACAAAQANSADDALADTVVQDAAVQDAVVQDTAVADNAVAGIAAAAAALGRVYAFPTEQKSQGRRALRYQCRCHFRRTHDGARSSQRQNVPPM